MHRRGTLIPSINHNKKFYIKRRTNWSCRSEVGTHAPHKYELHVIYFLYFFFSTSFFLYLANGPRFDLSLNHPYLLCCIYFHFFPFLKFLCMGYRRSSDLSCLEMWMVFGNSQGECLIGGGQAVLLIVIIQWKWVFLKENKIKITAGWSSL